MLLDLIFQIRDAKGNDKISIMESHPELKQIMELAYNPFKKFYLSAPGIVVNDEDGESIFDESIPDMLDNGTMNLLSDLKLRRLSGNTAIEFVANFIAGLNKKDAELFQRILDKDLRCGINVKTINKVWPGLIPETEDGAETIPTFRLMNLDEKKLVWPMLCAPKLDGVRGRFKRFNMYSRQGKIINGLAHIERALMELTHKSGMDISDFDGEIMVPGEIFDVGSGMIRSDNPTPTATYNIFDMPGHPGTKKERLIELNKIATENSIQGIDFIIHRWVHDMDELMASYKEYLKEGHEGIIVYNPDTLYKGNRSCDWMRIVPIKTADCEVIGFFEGKGKFTGTLGGIIVDYKGHKVKVGTGFQTLTWDELPSARKQKMNGPALQAYTRTVRDYIWNHKEEFLGKIAECQFKEETKAGSMRQPSFKGWRDDKTEPNFE